jgi:hypothetical protein
VSRNLYILFFNTFGTVVQIPVSRGSSVTAKYYKDVMLRKIEKHFNKVCPSSGMNA